MTRKWLSTHSGVDEGGISRYLRGASLKGLTANTVLRLARALGVDPGWLLCGRGDMIGVWVQIEPEPGKPLGDVRKRADNDGNCRSVANSVDRRP